jgi:hypothetical protein
LGIIDCPFQHLRDLSFRPPSSSSLPVYLARTVQLIVSYKYVHVQFASHAFSQSSPSHKCQIFPLLLVESKDIRPVYFAPSLTRVAIFSSIALSSRPVNRHVVSHNVSFHPKSHMLSFLLPSIPPKGSAPNSPPLSPQEQSPAMLTSMPNAPDKTRNLKTHLPTPQPSPFQTRSGRTRGAVC